VAASVPEGGAGAGRPASSNQLIALGRLATLLRKRFVERMSAEQWLIDAGARPPTYGALTVIRQRGPISQREVSDLLGHHPSDMVELVDMLERNGWVSRERDPEDRRRYQLTMTERGLVVLARYDEVAAEAEADVLSVLDDEERATLSELVNRIVEAHREGLARRV
jgi:DNA-binding MarR family transcriptional regulator